MATLWKELYDDESDESQDAEDLEFSTDSAQTPDVGKNGNGVNDASRQPACLTESSGWQSGHPSTSAKANLMELNDNKAGMQGLDKERINEIIENASKGSKFYEHQKKQQKKIEARILDLLERKNALTEDHLRHSAVKVDALVRKFEADRDLTRTIVHVDMDAFYAAVEMRDNKSLRDKPMAVGGEGMLSTSNYAARRFGVRAAMPGFIARKLCPDLIIVPLNFDKYRAVSAVVGSVFARYDPNYASMSLDEAYLDLTSYLRNDHNLRLPNDLTHAENVVSELREEIFVETELTASAGIAPNTFLAKVCSDINKPNGQFYLQPTKDTVLDFVSKLPVRKAFGIGKVTEQLLRSLGIITCQDLFDKRYMLSLLFTECSFHSFLSISLGLGNTRVGSDTPAKSISTERTFRDSGEPEFLHDLCKKLCQDLGDDLRSKGVTARAVTLKLKTREFDVKTKVRNMPEYTNDWEMFYRHVKPLLEFELASKNVAFRLMGVRATNLRDSNPSAVQKKTLKDFLVPSVEKSEKSCPICSRSLAKMTLAEVNRHIDGCLENGTAENAEPKREIPEIDCPVCGGKFGEKEIQNHVELCLDGASSSTSNESRKRPSESSAEEVKVKKPKMGTQTSLNLFFHRAQK